MIVLFICGLVASAWSAPQIPRRFDYDTSSIHFEEVNDIFTSFDTTVKNEGVEDNVFKIIIPLPGVDRNDVRIYANAGSLRILVTDENPGGGKARATCTRLHVYQKTLPDAVDVNGKWAFNNEVLKIALPLKPGVPLVQPSTLDDREYYYFKLHSGARNLAAKE